MQVRLPPDTRREFDWMLGLSGEGVLVAFAGVLVILVVWAQPWPESVRVPGALVLLLGTAVLAWGRWPLEEGGDRLTVWAGRLWRYGTHGRGKLLREGAHHGTPTPH